MMSSDKARGRDWPWAASAQMGASASAGQNFPYLYCFLTQSLAGFSAYLETAPEGLYVSVETLSPGSNRPDTFRVVRKKRHLKYFCVVLNVVFMHKSIFLMILCAYFMTFCA